MVTQTHFKQLKLNEFGYQLTVDFTGAQTNTTSTHTTLFQKYEDAYSSEIIDIYSQNGNAHKTFMKKLFDNNDAAAIQKASNKLSLLNEKKSTIIVLDIKDMKKSYVNTSEISQCEENYVQFISTEKKDQNTSRASKIQQALSGKINHVFAEGRLKSHLLKTLAPDQIDWFLSKEGSSSFCQFAEFYTIAFKHGFSPSGLNPNDYFLKASSIDNFKPVEKSTVWYPEVYKDLYAPDNLFFQGIRPIFSVSGSGFDPLSGITSIATEIKV